MLVLTITLAPITSYAKSYVSDDTVVITSDMHNFFNNYFDYTDSYLYFPYECGYSDYNRTCYFGINQDNEYVDITYSGSGYNYDRLISTGVDNSFSVSGSNVIRKSVSVEYVLLLVAVFFSIINVVDKLLGGGYRVK